LVKKNCGNLNTSSSVREPLLSDYSNEELEDEDFIWLQLKNAQLYEHNMSFWMPFRLHLLLEKLADIVSRNCCHFKSRGMKAKIGRMFFGLASGLPLCCVIEYCLLGGAERLGFLIDKCNDEEIVQMYNADGKWEYLLKVWYIPCRRCYEGEKTVSHRVHTLAPTLGQFDGVK
jgi:hypothetical protein